MKKKKILIIAAAIVLVLAAAVLYTRHAVKAEEQRRENVVYVSRAVSYSYDLNINMPVDYYGLDLDKGTYDEELLLNYTTHDDWQVYIRVAYFDLKTGSDLTYQELYDSYDAFLAGEEEDPPVIEVFHTTRVYDRETVVINGEEVTEDQFEMLVYSKAKDLYDVSIHELTFEQLDAAIDAVVNGDCPEVL